MIDERQRVRDAFQRADNNLEPSMENLLATVPDLVNEGRRRRHAWNSSGSGFMTLLMPLAWRAVPRLGAVAALLLALSLVLYATVDEAVPAAEGGVESSLPSEAMAKEGVEQLILMGNATVDDPLLQAIAGSEGDG